METFQKLHNSLMYVCSDKELKLPLEQLPKTVFDQKLLRKYIDYQAEYHGRVLLLKTEPRARPAEAHGDRIMPPIMKKWIGALNSHQNTTKNHDIDSSCAFDDARISKYEQANETFAADVKKNCPTGAAKVAALVVMDIAYIKSLEVDWESQPTALAGSPPAESDDEAGEVAFLHWDFTNPDSIPWNTLSVCDAHGKFYPHALVAGKIGAFVIVNRDKNDVPVPISTYMSKVNKAKKDLQPLVAAAGDSFPENVVKVTMSRDFYEEEERYFHGLCKALDGDSDEDDESGDSVSISLIAKFPQQPSCKRG